jgi:hypothetical protein
MAEAAESNTSTKLSSNPANDPGPSSSGIASSSGKPEEVRVGEERKDSCTPKFDALWFCYCELIPPWLGWHRPPTPVTAAPSRLLAPPPIGCPCLFIAAPGYQLQQYYIHGRVDDCSFKWTEFMDCLKKKTKFKDEVRGAVGCARLPRTPWLPP